MCDFVPPEGRLPAPRAKSFSIQSRLERWRVQRFVRRTMRGDGAQAAKIP
jgi:hypothetical protein